MVRLEGWKQYESKLRKAGPKLLSLVDAEVGDISNEWAELAIRAAPADEGFLRNGIAAVKIKPMEWEVISRAAYSAYMEWGTGSKVNVPSEYAGYASEFRGKSSGSFDDFFLAILEWVRRKGINSGAKRTKSGRRSGTTNQQLNEDFDIAFRIALKILRVGVNPQPYFFIWRAMMEQKLMGRLKIILS
jgi:hypothetical protein